MVDLVLQPSTQLKVAPDHSLGRVDNPHEGRMHIIRVMRCHDDRKFGEDAVLDVKVPSLLRRSNDKHVRTTAMAAKLFSKRFQSSRLGRMRGELWRDVFRVGDQAGLQDRFRKVLICLGIHLGRILDLRTVSSGVDEVDAWLSSLNEKAVKMSVVHNRMMKVDIPHALPLVQVAMSADH